MGGALGRQADRRTGAGRQGRLTCCSGRASYRRRMAAVPLPPRFMIGAALAARRSLIALADLMVPAPIAVFDASIGTGRSFVLGAVAELGSPICSPRAPRTRRRSRAGRTSDPDVLHRLLRGAAVMRVISLLPDGRFRETRLTRDAAHRRPGVDAPVVPLLHAAFDRGRLAGPGRQRSFRSQRVPPGARPLGLGLLRRPPRRGAHLRRGDAGYDHHGRAGRRRRLSLARVRNRV